MKAVEIKPDYKDVIRFINRGFDHTDWPDFLEQYNKSHQNFFNKFSTNKITNNVNVLLSNTTHDYKDQISVVENISINFTFVNKFWETFSEVFSSVLYHGGAAVYSRNKYNDKETIKLLDTKCPGISVLWNKLTYYVHNFVSIHDDVKNWAPHYHHHFRIASIHLRPNTTISTNKIHNLNQLENYFKGFLYLDMDYDKDDKLNGLTQPDIDIYNEFFMSSAFVWRGRSLSYDHPDDISDVFKFTLDDENDEDYDDDPCMYVDGYKYDAIKDNVHYQKYLVSQLNLYKAMCWCIYNQNLFGFVKMLSFADSSLFSHIHNYKLFHLLMHKLECGNTTDKDFVNIAQTLSTDFNCTMEELVDRNERTLLPCKVPYSAVVNKLGRSTFTRWFNGVVDSYDKFFTYDNNDAKLKLSFSNRTKTYKDNMQKVIDDMSKILNGSNMFDKFANYSITVSVKINDFLRLGDYTCDSTSCFRMSRELTLAPMVLATSPDTVVVYLHQGTNVIARAIGVVNDSTLCIFNVYRKESSSLQFDITECHMLFAEALNKLWPAKDGVVYSKTPDKFSKQEIYSKYYINDFLYEPLDLGESHNTFKTYGLYLNSDTTAYRYLEDAKTKSLPIFNFGFIANSNIIWNKMGYYINNDSEPVNRIIIPDFLSGRTVRQTDSTPYTVGVQINNKTYKFYTMCLDLMVPTTLYSNHFEKLNKEQRLKTKCAAVFGSNSLTLIVNKIEDLLLPNNPNYWYEKISNTITNSNNSNTKVSSEFVYPLCAFPILILNKRMKEAYVDLGFGKEQVQLTMSTESRISNNPSNFGYPIDRSYCTHSDLYNPVSDEISDGVASMSIKAGKTLLSSATKTSVIAANVKYLCDYFNLDINEIPVTDSVKDLIKSVTKETASV